MTVPPDNPTRGTSEPGRYWTTVNMGEAAPDVLSPMCWSVWGEPAERGWLYSMYAFGVLSKGQCEPSSDRMQWGVGVFYGRLAVNVDAVRAVVASLPGVDGDDFERELWGSTREDPPPVTGDAKRIAVIAVRAPKTLLRQRRTIARLHDTTSAWWRDEVYGDGSGGSPLDRLLEARDRFIETFRHHCVTRFMFSGAQSAVTDAAAKAGHPLLAAQLIAGVGGVLETRMSDDVWRLAHGDLDEDTFLRSWGYHGPNEGNPSAVVWREDPRPVRQLAKAYVDRATQRPRDRESQAQRAAAQAEEALLAATPRLRRSGLRWLLARTRHVVRTLQVGKASYLMSIDGVRKATRALGAELVASGVLREAEDAFFLTIDECVALDAGRLDDVQALVDRRRSDHESYRTLSLPVFFHGLPEPVAPLPSVPGQVGDTTLTGAASGGGVVVGRARVLLDVNDDIDLEDGDILVCRFTDPSWAPLMSLAEALVIDMGGSASHGAVVARELGIPFVIGTGNGTSVLRDGDRIEVDGRGNTVRVLSPVAPAG
ncbi:MAG TPA: PEP-utilizing enzyme [Mycobacteriales bacterium]|nr:PEP-utilizing enzyme [Mycobacteriales bacterium]